MTELILQTSGPHVGQPVRSVGAELEDARSAMILVHGRGASAADMLPLVDHLAAPGFIYLAPEASGDVWYPNRYDTPLAGNEPWLSSALAGLGGLVDRLVAAGIPSERVILTGFSQGACLCAEYAARNARRYGGLGILAGGLIGPKDTLRDYPGSLEKTPVYLGCSDPDPYFSPEWIRYSAEIFARLGARVESKLFPDLGHRINLDMLRAVRSMVDAIKFQEAA
jgi:phospholipase/carboxylesterase